MRIRTQFLLLFLFGLSVVGGTGFLILGQLRRADRLTESMQAHREGLIVLNNFQTAAQSQILYGVDLVRTGDITGERIVSYRMTETRLSREIAALTALYSLEAELHPAAEALQKRGARLAKLCKEEMADPLYARRIPEEGLIERLIYDELEGLQKEANTLRAGLNRAIRESLARQRRQKRRFSRITLPAAASGLLLIFLLNGAILRRSILSIDRTRLFLGRLADGRSRLDLSLPEKGRDEVARLCANFNRFMAGLNSRRRALKAIADEQLAAEERLNRLSREHGDAVGRINRGLSAVRDHTADMAYRADSSAEELRQIADSLDSLEETAQEQEERAAGMTGRGDEVRRSLEIQEEAVRRQALLNGHLRKEGEAVQGVLGVLKEQIREILDQSQEISEALGTIGDLADQTDILAINASIEAAHAGSWGAGFSVVSEEMRRLAGMVRQNSSRVGGLLAGLEEKLGLMADGEKRNRASMEGLIHQNKQAEEAGRRLEESMDAIRRIFGEFIPLLEEVRSGASRVHGEARRVRAGGGRIRTHMDELRQNKRTLAGEWEEMTRESRRLAEGTAVLQDLSGKNRDRSERLNREIRRFGAPGKGS